MADRIWFIASFLSPLIFRYHLPLNVKNILLDSSSPVFHFDAVENCRIPSTSEIKLDRYFNHDEIAGLAGF